MAGRSERGFLAALALMIGAALVGAAILGAGGGPSPARHPHPDGGTETAPPVVAQPQHAPSRPGGSQGATVSPSPGSGSGSGRASTNGIERSAFPDRLAPLIASVNSSVLADRATLWTLRAQAGTRLQPEQRLRLQALADKYETSADDIAELSRRIDLVPPSIVIAAAAVATDWGRKTMPRDWAAMSAPAAPQQPGRASAGPALRQGSSQAGGRLPVPARGEDAAMTAIRDYVQMLDVHPAYERFRKERERLRLSSRPVTGSELAASLPFSPTRESIQQAITAERLDGFDAAAMALRQP